MQTLLKNSIKLPQLDKAREAGFVYPLIAASALGYTDIVKSLLEEEKARLKKCKYSCKRSILKDKAGRTALHWAAKEGRIHIVELLLAAFGKCLRLSRTFNLLLKIWHFLPRF